MLNMTAKITFLANKTLIGGDFNHSKKVHGIDPRKSEDYNWKRNENNARWTDQEWCLQWVSSF